ncbi:serine protease snake-like [Galleria mellonella]|uniref:Serine protease snake-like n=1 Tax=Galleria mellonella TaxID=7137 RepID=A0A6J3C1K5_GALME|nr:serine protease snake-like [Galleria mellonella]
MVLKNIFYFIIMWNILAFLLFMCVSVNGDSKELFEGDLCDAGAGQQAFCLHIQECMGAVAAAKNGTPYTICTYRGKDPIVCCLDALLKFTPIAVERSDYQDQDGCIVSTKRTGLQIGQKALEKCLKYQQNTCPCKTGASGISFEDIIAHGENAELNEFSNMALLGYGDNITTAQWSCGGSVISERYILTAGHCISGREIGDVKFIALGILARTDLKKDVVYSVERIIRHPEYKPPVKYHDIALLKTDRDISFSLAIKPACLEVDNIQREGHEATAIGWGTLGDGDDTANTLQKTKLYQFPHQECSDRYRPTRLLRNGINQTIQMCYGHKTRPTDTCQGDSGGPLLISNKFRCLHSIVGVTSFGSACGHTGIPGVYIRLVPYLPWIESVVWP